MSLIAYVRPPWRTLLVPRELLLYRLVPGFLNAIEPSGEILEQGKIVCMGEPRWKDLGHERQVVVDITIDDVTFFVLVRDISDRMKDMNAMALRAAEYGRMSVDAIYDVLWSYSLGRWVVL